LDTFLVVDGSEGFTAFFADVGRRVADVAVGYFTGFTFFEWDFRKDVLRILKCFCSVEN
jgi:hypothetical protein